MNLPVVWVLLFTIATLVMVNQVDCSVLPENARVTAAEIICSLCRRENSNCVRQLCMNDIIKVIPVEKE